MEEPPAQNVKRHAVEVTIAVSLLLFMSVLSIGSIRRESLTYDEIFHLSAGLAFWQQHDTRLSPEHPPLLRMIATIPLVVNGTRPNYALPAFCGAAPCEWWFAKQFLEHFPRKELENTAFLARLPMLTLTLMLGILLYWFARRLWGSRAALIVLVAFCTSPFFLSYGALVITDVGLVVFVILSGWAFASLLESPSLRHILLFAAATAGAVVSKFSAILLFPGMLVVWVWWYRLRRKERVPCRASAYRVIFGIVLSWILVFAFYAVFTARTWPPTLLADQIHSMPQSLTVHQLAAQQFDFMQRHPSLIRPLQPLWLYLTGTWRLIAWFEHTSYLLGSWRSGGTWYYFPAVTFFKTSPGLLLLWLLIPVVLVRRGAFPWKGGVVAQQFQTHSIVLLCFLAVFAASAIFSDVNIGIRHFSVPIALLTLACGIVPSELAKSNLNLSVQRAILGIPILTCLCTALSSYPHYLSYFNFFRDSIPKQEIAIDSNLDWGQSLLELEDFRASHNIPVISVNAFLLLDPATYVTGARPWVCGNGIPPGTEWLAVSANWMTSAQPSCSYLLKYAHSAIADGTMYVIHVH